MKADPSGHPAVLRAARAANEAALAEGRLLRALDKAHEAHTTAHREYLRVLTLVESGDL